MSHRDFDVDDVAALLAEACDPRYYSADSIKAALTSGQMLLIIVPEGEGIGLALAYTVTEEADGRDMEILAVNGTQEGGPQWTVNTMPLIREVAAQHGVTRITAMCERAGMISILEGLGFAKSATLMTAEV